jgi:hypothetical protein
MVPPVFPEMGMGAWSTLAEGAVARNAAITTIMTRNPTKTPSMTDEVVDSPCETAGMARMGNWGIWGAVAVGMTLGVLVDAPMFVFTRELLYLINGKTDFCPATNANGNVLQQLR